MAVLQTEVPSDNQVSIVIPTYQRSQLAFKLASQIRILHPFTQITIVDQQCPLPPDPEVLIKLNVCYINLGIVNTSIAKNRGIKESKGSVIFFFDDDIEITKETIPSQLASYENTMVVGTCGRVINDHEEVPKNTDVDTGKTNFFGTKFLLNFWSTKRQYVDFPYGCNMSFRKDVLIKVGGFDEKFIKIFEEIDLGLRITKKYGKIEFVPEALTYHHKAKTGGTRSTMKEKMRMIYSHYGRYLAKNVPFPFSLITLVLRARSALYEAPFALKDLLKNYFIHE